MKGFNYSVSYASFDGREKAQFEQAASLRYFTLEELLDPG